MSGIGEVVTPLENGVEWPMILINPRVEVPTPTVFKALKEKNNPPMKTPFPDWQNADDARVWLQNERNDLEAPAIAAQPVIGAAIEALRASQNCTLARMSGSGATCFGIYPTKIARDDALRVLQSAHPNWWVTATQTIAA
jgi:4-diphosphocytidyl-2-C-methyl-D-erythritol kinase